MYYPAVGVVLGRDKHKEKIDHRLLPSSPPHRPTIRSMLHCLYMYIANLPIVSRRHISRIAKQQASSSRASILNDNRRRRYFAKKSDGCHCVPARLTDRLTRDAPYREVIASDRRK